MSARFIVTNVTENSQLHIEYSISFVNKCSKVLMSFVNCCLAWLGGEMV